MTNTETGYEKAHQQVEQIFRQFFPAMPHDAGRPVWPGCGPVRRRCGTGKDLCLPGCLRAVAAAKATTDAAPSGDFHRQCRPSKRYSHRVHTVFIGCFNTKWIYPETYLCCAAKRKRTLCLLVIGGS